MQPVNGRNFPPSDQVSGVIMCCWFQRCVVMKVDGCGWKGCSLPRCQVPFFHLNSISHSAHVDGAYCWLLALVSVAQRITLQSVHISPHIPLRLATSARIQASATRKWTAVLSGWKYSSSEWCDVINFSSRITSAHEDVNVGTIFPHADLFLW